MSGNFVCTRCGEFFASLSLVGHEWVCDACKAPKAAGGPTAQALADGGTTTLRHVSPVAAEALEYGWPKAGDVVESYRGAKHICREDILPVGPIPSRGLTYAAPMWMQERVDAESFRYRRIKSPPAEPRNPAEPAAADDFLIQGGTAPGMSIIKSGTTGTCRIAFGDSGSSVQGQIIYDNKASSDGAGAEGDMSDEAIDARWRKWPGVGSAAIVAFVRSEVKRARPPKLMDVDISRIVTDVAVRIEGPVIAYSFACDVARAIERRLRGEL